MTESEGAKSKLREQATAKADLSYSYWAANEVNAAPAAQARKLTDEEAKTQEKLELQSKLSGQSAWNAAGTFEERNLSTWVEKVLPELFVGRKWTICNGVSAEINKLSSSGEACQWVVRGKTRAHYELVLNMAWTADSNTTKFSGSVRVPNAAWDELDELEVEVTSSTVVEGDGEPLTREVIVNSLLPLLKNSLLELARRICQYSLNS